MRLPVNFGKNTFYAVDLKMTASEKKKGHHSAGLGEYMRCGAKSGTIFTI